MRSQNANQMVDSGQTKIKICGLYRDADISTQSINTSPIMQVLYSIHPATDM